MKLKFWLLAIFIIAGATLSVETQALTSSQISEVVNAYRYYKEVSSNLNTPAVLEIPFANEFIERFDFVVFDITANTFEPYYFKQQILINEIPVSISANPYAATVGLMNDHDLRTYADFSLPDNAQGYAQITLASANPITSSFITAILDNNVALPTSVEIRALVEGQNRIVVANTRMDRPTIYFPQTTSASWTIAFSFSQPLRFSELRLNQDGAEKSSVRTVRFLSQPNHAYRIYFDPDRSAVAPVGEAGNLVSAKDVTTVSINELQSNPNYIIADVDYDLVPDIRDNCVFIYNSDQADANNNGRGDLCDDFDIDGIINSQDNCPNNPNLNQEDVDSDGVGDVCDQIESRITERYAWIPWAGIGFAAVVLIILFVLTAKSISTSGRKDNY